MKMKVNVAYTTVITKTIDVDEKYAVLRTNDPGYEDLTWGRERHLMDALLQDCANQIDCNEGDIQEVYDSETDEILAEG